MVRRGSGEDYLYYRLTATPSSMDLTDGSSSTRRSSPYLRHNGWHCSTEITSPLTQLTQRSGPKTESVQTQCNSRFKSRSYGMMEVSNGRSDMRSQPCFNYALSTPSLYRRRLKYAWVMNDTTYTRG